MLPLDKRTITRQGLKATIGPTQTIIACGSVRVGSTEPRRTAQGHSVLLGQHVVVSLTQILLDDSAVNTIRCHVIRHIKEPESFPFLRDRT